MFDIEIHIPTKEEAFSSLVWRVKRLDWYNENKYFQQQECFDELDSEIINSMIMDNKLSEQELHKKYYKLFVDKLYNEKEYQTFADILYEAVKTVQKCYPRYVNLQKSWGFNIFSKYIVEIDLFSPMGSYFAGKDIGKIIFGVRRKDFEPERIIGHEILHLGIENNIISPNVKPRFKQNEKERIVDNLCFYVMQDIIPYQFQDRTIGFEYMDEVVGKQPENNLVISANEYKKINN